MKRSDKLYLMHQNQNLDIAAVRQFRKSICGIPTLGKASQSKKNGGGRGNWGKQGDELIDDEYNFAYPRRRSNSFSCEASLALFKTKFEEVEPQPTFEEHFFELSDDVIMECNRVHDNINNNLNNHINSAITSDNDRDQNRAYSYHSSEPVSCETMPRAPHSILALSNVRPGSGDDTLLFNTLNTPNMWCATNDARLNCGLVAGSTAPTTITATDRTPRPFPSPGAKIH